MALARNAGFTSAIATDPADTAAGLLTPDRYNLPHVVSGATVGSIPYFSAADAEECSDMTWKANGTAGEGLVIPAGTATTDVNALRVTQTWNNAGVTFTAMELAVTKTAATFKSFLADFTVGGSTKFKIDEAGLVSGADVQITSDGGLRFSNSNTVGDTTGWLAGIFKVGQGQLRFTDGTNVTTKARTEANKSVTSIADNTATATFTVTVPNAAHSAMLKVTLIGSLGAGGAVGANEATGTISYDFAIARTAGVATVVTASTAYGSATSAVAGAATITITAAASAISGANSATQTFTINVTIARGSGASTNHTCLCYGRLLNANASGITIA